MANDQRSTATTNSQRPTANRQLQFAAMTTVAAVQASPVFLDREATLDLVCTRITEAAAA